MGGLKKNNTWLKKCSACKKYYEVIKNNWFFRKSGRRKGCPISYCKNCGNLKLKEYYQRHPEKNIARKKRYYEKNKEAISIRAKKRYKKGWFKKYYLIKKDAINKRRRELRLLKKNTSFAK